MRWRHKARIQKVCAAVPYGGLIYARLQRRFGNLTADPFRRVPHHVRMLEALRRIDRPVQGARCLEVGTGHLPTMPILFHLIGAREIVTVDLHRRLQWDLTARVMRTLIDAADDLVARYAGLVDEAALRERLRAMGAFDGRPLEFFDYAGIRYLAPADAALMSDAAGSFDLHFSTTVFEHIETEVLAGILGEGRRLLGPDGVACHIIDPSDHFAHTDQSISLINFLRFSEREWATIAGNEFGYCNRLRVPALLAAFSAAGFTVTVDRAVVDKRSWRLLDDGFPVDAAFAGLAPEDLCTVWLELTAQPR